MTRFSPPTFAPSDVKSMLALLDAASPYMDMEKRRVYFEIANPNSSLFPPIFVALQGDEDELSARREAAEAINILPYFHALVVALPDDALYSDEYWVSHLDVDHGEIDVCYIGTVNAIWHNRFRKDDDGQWRSLADSSSVVEMPTLP